MRSGERRVRIRVGIRIDIKRWDGDLNMEKLRIEIGRVAGAFFSDLSFRFLLVMHLRLETDR